MLGCREEGIRKVCGDFGAELREFNRDYHHMYLLAEYPPKTAISELVNSLKGVLACGAGAVNRHLMRGHFWSRSYLAASCSGAPLTIVKQYSRGRPG
jgi:REP-associated tyrosine transposase